MLLRVRPVVRPLFFTAWPTDAATVDADSVPTSRMAPVVLTMPVRTCAIAQSTFGVLAGGYSVESDDTSATMFVFPELQLLSTRPGWFTSSPICVTRPLPPETTSPANTWLLLRMYCVLPMCTSEPSVPLQQKPFAMSLTLPPDVPSWIGGVCFAVWLVPPPPPFIAWILPVTSSITL